MKKSNKKIVNIFLMSLIFLVTLNGNLFSQNISKSLAEGKALYTTYCANCHGNQAQGAIKAGFDISIITERGGKQPPDLTDQVWDHGSSDTDILKIIKEGITANMMP